MLVNPVQARVIFECALRERFALLAVNADSPAAVIDCLEAARRCDAPILIEASLWQLQGRGFGAGDAVRGLTMYLAMLMTMANDAPYRDVPVIFHTDHIRGPRTTHILERAIQGVVVSDGGQGMTLRASTISLDSSELTDEENIRMIRGLCAFAQKARVALTLEMEAGIDDGVTPTAITEKLLGSVERLYPGIVHLFAPGLGTRHGYSRTGYPAFSPEAVQAHLDVARKATGRKIGIALHGSSGLSEDALQEAVAAGVVKVNWSTGSLAVRSRAALDYYMINRDRLQPAHPDFKTKAMDHALQSYVSKVYLPAVRRRIRLIGACGKAPLCMRAIGT